MVLFRALQGVGGAFIVPLAQATLFDINPREKHGQAMAMFGAGIMIGPILGPVLGGWLTDNYNWRWVFLVNLPVGISARLLHAALHAQDPRSTRASSTCSASPCSRIGARRAAADARPRRAERLVRELGDLIIELGPRDRRRLDVRRPHGRPPSNPFFDRAMFTDRNFATGLVFMAVTGMLLLAGLALLPPLLQNLYGYSVLQSGFLTAPRGVGTLISMMHRRPADRQDRRAAAGRHRRRR